MQRLALQATEQALLECSACPRRFRLALDMVLRGLSLFSGRGAGFVVEGGLAALELLPDGAVVLLVTEGRQCTRASTCGVVGKVLLCLLLEGLCVHVSTSTNEWQTPTTHARAKKGHRSFRRRMERTRWRQNQGAGTHEWNSAGFRGCRRPQASSAKTPTCPCSHFPRRPAAVSEDRGQ